MICRKRWKNLNNSEAHLRTRVAGLKSILENNEADKKLLVALKPLMMKTSATVKATNQAVEALMIATLLLKVTEANAKDISDMWMEFEKLRGSLTGEMSSVIHTKIMNMETDGGLTIGSRVALCNQLHDTSGTCPLEVENLR